MDEAARQMQGLQEGSDKVIRGALVVVLLIGGMIVLCALIGAFVGWLFQEDTEENAEHDKGDKCAKN